MEASPLKGKQEQEENDDGEWNGGRNVAVEEGDTFDIPPKGASIERLRRWRQAVLVLNASRRFRYTLDLKQEEGNERIRRKIRAHAQVIRAAFLFQEAGERHIPKTELPAVLPCGFGIGDEQLTSMTRDHNYSALQDYGGANKGITGDDADLVSRRNAFGSNTYPHKKGKCFWVFLWEACQDLTLIILMVAAALSLALGIKTEGIKEGWYDGGSIAFAVFLVIVVTATSDYKQSLQFKHLNEEMQNIHVEVIGSGKRLSVSIFDLVVGDAVPLKIGGQVPADGLLISGQSLAIDESSMTGESKIVRKDQKSPFLMSGCKVADGYGTMLLTAVGMNTEWGLLMATISEDNGEETPLQVRLNGVATMIGMVGLAVAGAVLVVLMARHHKMTVVEAYVGEKNVAVASNADSLSRTVNSLLVEGIAQNSTGSVYEPEKQSYCHDGGAIEITGSPTEKAILGWGVELKMRFDEVRSKSSIIHASPFNSEKKRGGVAVRVGDSDVRVHWKGAAEIILDLCTSWIDSSGAKHEILLTWYVLLVASIHVQLL
ncbi:Calcium-transporting ATPase [Rhynchospora pubera]|uniref:Calcium-transporting ATPase n=1 Tax=Rhynchospora pubera TaxID=906938 RepID=A0AAV8BYT2_9POAL|nr:Calcium-transporting ATPase [Rhynchospora pubera]